MHIAGVVLHNLMKIFSQFDHLFMACLVVLHGPATFAPARGKLTSPPIPPPTPLPGGGTQKERGGGCDGAWHHCIHSSIHSLIASTQVSIHLPQEKLRDWGGGLGGPACFEGPGAVATTGG